MEAGLNDGLSVPFLLFFIAIAAARVEGGKGSLTEFIGEQLGFGVLVGLAIGLAGGWLLGLARRKQWIAESFEQIGVVALPLLCLVVSDMVGASMFIAAFVAGLAVQVGFKEAGKQSVEFAEEWGQLLNLAVFFPVRHGGSAGLAAVQRGILDIRASKPDDCADVAGGNCAHWYASQCGERDLHGLVRAARPGVDCAWLWSIWSRKCISRVNPLSVTRCRQPCSLASCPRTKRDAWASVFMGARSHRSLLTPRSTRVKACEALEKAQGGSRWRFLFKPTPARAGT